MSNFKVVCIAGDGGWCMLESRTILGIKLFKKMSVCPGPKKGDVVHVKDAVLIDGLFGLSFEEYNVRGYYNANYFRALSYGEEIAHQIEYEIAEKKEEVAR